MEEKIKLLMTYIKTLCEKDVDRIIQFVTGIASANQQPPDRPQCPHCGGSHVIKYGHKGTKQRFLCHDCKKTFMHTTGTVMFHSRQSRSTWSQFISDTLDGGSLDSCADNCGFSHQTAFNMRHKLLIALSDLQEKSPTVLSGVAEFDETYVLESYKGTKVPAEAGRKARKHGAKASKSGISNEYIAICTGIQRDGGAVVGAANRAKPSKDELRSIFEGHIAEGTLAITDGLKSYSVFNDSFKCSVVDMNQSKGEKFYNLNTVNGLHSYIKTAYVRYKGLATKYLNRYNAMFSLVYRCSKGLGNRLFASISNIGKLNCYHSVKDIQRSNLFTPK